MSVVVDCPESSTTHADASKRGRSQPDKRSRAEIRSSGYDGVVGHAQSLETLIAPGAVIAGRYRVEGVLGRGGMGVVVSATQLVLERPVAVKLCMTAGANSEGIERFKREARHAACLESEHIARVMDVGTLPNGISYIAMERLVGSDLRQLLLDHGPLSIERAVDLILQACVGVAQAHAAGIVHRDLKPANLFLARCADGKPRVKVLDFGISKQLHADSEAASDTSGVLGSPLYMSPEQLRSTGHVTGRTDLWSLGATLFELVSGSPAFAGDNAAQIVASVLHEPPPNLRKLVADAPEALEDVIRWCLEKDPVKRCPSVAALARALSSLGSASGRAYVERVEACAVSGESTLEQVPAPWVTSVPREPAVKRGIFAVAAVAAVVSAAVLVASRAGSDAPTLGADSPGPSERTVTPAVVAITERDAKPLVAPAAPEARGVGVGVTPSGAAAGTQTPIRKRPPATHSGKRTRLPAASEQAGPERTESLATPCPDPLCARK